MHNSHNSNSHTHSSSSRPSTGLVRASLSPPPLQKLHHQQTGSSARGVAEGDWARSCPPLLVPLLASPPSSRLRSEPCSPQRQRACVPPSWPRPPLSPFPPPLQL